MSRGRLERIDFQESGLPIGATRILGRMWDVLQDLAETNQQLMDNNLRMSQQHSEQLNKATLQAAIANSTITEMRSEQRKVQKMFGALLLSILIALLTLLFHIPLPSISL